MAASRQCAYVRADGTRCDARIEPDSPRALACQAHQVAHSLAVKREYARRRKERIKA